MINSGYLPCEFVQEVEYFNCGDKTDNLPNDQEELKYVEDFCKTLRNRFNVSTAGGEKEITGSSWFQGIFNQCALDACVYLVMGDKNGGEVNRFSTEKDHLGREMSRLIVNSKPNTCRFIVDVYANLDARLVISKLKRFILTHIPRKWSSINFNDIVPRILFRVKIWDSPRSYYRVTLYSCPMNVEYSYKIENARNLVGLPRSVDPKEVKCYERADLDIRRAIFGESTNVFKK